MTQEIILVRFEHANILHDNLHQHSSVVVFVTDDYPSPDEGETIAEYHDVKTRVTSRGYDQLVPDGWLVGAIIEHDDNVPPVRDVKIAWQNEELDDDELDRALKALHITE